MTQPVLDIQQLHLSFPGFNGDVHALIAYIGDIFHCWEKMLLTLGKNSFVSGAAHEWR